jgi:hypothetical protein
MDPNEENEEPTIKDLMAKFEELGTRMTALETPPDPDTKDKDDAEFEDPETKIVATDPANNPEDSDPKKTYEDGGKKDDEDEEEKAFVRGAEFVMKKFASQLGITKLSAPGVVNESKPTTKQFAEFVVDEATANHGGDQSKATAHILTNKGKFPDAFKAYEAQRNL